MPSKAVFQQGEKNGKKNFTIFKNGEILPQVKSTLKRLLNNLLTDENALQWGKKKKVSISNKYFLCKIRITAIATISSIYGAQKRVNKTYLIRVKIGMIKVEEF